MYTLYSINKTNTVMRGIYQLSANIETRAPLKGGWSMRGDVTKINVFYAIKLKKNPARRCHTLNLLIKNVNFF